MRITIQIIICLLIFTSCDQKNMNTKCAVQIFQSGGRNNIEQQIENNLYMIAVENKPAKIKLFYITKGKKQLKHEFVFDPEIHQIAYLLPQKQKDNIYMHFGVKAKTPQGIKPEVGTKEIPIGNPFRVQGDGGGSTTNLTMANKVSATFNIYETKDVNLSNNETFTIESKVKASSEKDVSFIIIVVEAIE